MPEELARQPAGQDGDHGQSHAQYRRRRSTRSTTSSSGRAPTSRPATRSRSATAQEQQSSSGIIVSTGLGSTGWLKSVYAGWSAATHSLLKRQVETVNDGAFPWDADYLHYFVREPYPSRVTGATIVIGRIAHAETMSLVSQMPENGVIFSDGIESDYLEFNSGTQAAIAVAEKQGLLAA